MELFWLSWSSEFALHNGHIYINWPARYLLMQNYLSKKMAHLMVRTAVTNIDMTLIVEVEAYSLAL